jgi:hypothetical protein
MPSSYRKSTVSSLTSSFGNSSNYDCMHNKPGPSAIKQSGLLAASFCHQVAALVGCKFCSFYYVKNHKIINNLTTTKAREKHKHRFGILKNFQCMFDLISKHNQILLNFISHRFLVTITQ